MPLASMENVTSICGTPRGARRMPVSWKRPSSLFWCAIGRSPCSTWISTDDWKLEAVVKIWLLRMGSVVLRSMMRVQTPPSVSMPSDSGVTSSSSSPFTLPQSTPACKHAPMATHSSGLMPLNGSEPVIDWTRSCTAGMRLEPPTISTLLICEMLMPESLMAWLTGSRVAWTR